MGIKILRLRHRTAPVQNGCRWCGFEAAGHGNAWIPSRGWHTFVDPTDAQRKARLRVLQEDRRIPTIVTNVANDARTRL